MAGKDLKLDNIRYNWPKLFIKPPEGDEIDAEDITSGLRFLDDDSDAVLTNTYANDAIMDGQAYSYSQVGMNTINSRFVLHYGDWYDYKMKKHEIARFFMQKGLYRIRTDAEPGIVKFVRAGNFTIKNPEDRSHYIQFTIPWENPSGVKWSLPYSDDLMEYDQDLWQYGMNLPNGIDLHYHYVNTHNFDIYNASDIDIDPVERYPLQIIVTGFHGKFDMVNETTGDEIVYTEPLEPEDKLVWDNLSVYKNGELDNGSSNLAWIRLKRGWNHFKIYGYDNVDIRFHFRFVYLN
ncbi:phage tail family protein [Limosilactobacillus panis]|uniref:phage tail domain-containing protein n=1 Tax=Limosilactobacillus panis TaxID=47493 RepID=UPI001C94E1A1|nr:phage tail domain-containing protein [Limosilactobacillus panis]QZN93819.1 phage tail family protein [Limosilactobacillus panis]UUF81176.1 phage tail family protein [Xanthomonas oryzae pv. oryzae]